jgi:hypothetical protein
MAEIGWKQLLEGWPWFRGEGSFPLRPNSEFMPPLRLLRKPYGTDDPVTVSEDDPWGWPINEYEEETAIQPGLESIAGHLMKKLVGLCRGDSAGAIDEYKLRDNPYWPKELRKHADCLSHERFVLLLPVALSRTQDDKARMPWTLFGSSEQGPARAFWKGFFTAPDREVPRDLALDFFRGILAHAYQELEDQCRDLLAAGFRILTRRPAGEAFPEEGPLPSWAGPYLLQEDQPLRGVRYLLTFRPFADLPENVRKRYLSGKLHLLPFPGSMLFWGAGPYLDLRKQLPFAVQIPLMHFLERHQGIGDVRVPQSGWFHEDGPAVRDAHPHRGPIRETYKRTHRTARVHRYEDELVAAHEHKMAHVLFSTRPEDIGLYTKPMARNSQLWTDDFRLLLDGPAANAEQIRHAADTVAAGGLFGYRFLFPAMRVGRHELYWHRPLAVYLDSNSGRPVPLLHAPLGYFTAYGADDPDLRRPVELWPRLLRREEHLVNIELFKGMEEEPPRRTMMNVRKLFYARDVMRRSLPRSFGRRLLTLEKNRTLDGWLRGLANSSPQPERGRWLAEQITRRFEPTEPVEAPEALTYEHTSRRSFEVEYWSTIERLSSGHFINKNNGDCVLDKETQARLTHPGRDLEYLGDHLLSYYTRLAASLDMADQVLIGEQSFRWQTEYHFPWMGGWVANEQGNAHERNLIVVIPGRDHSRAVLMADHYDTAYMHDVYETTGARLAAAGADDNCSATAALMLGAKVFLELSRQGRLDCDVWLVHLTGEEYPAEGLGACRLCQALVEESLRIQTRDGTIHDLSGVRVGGLYVLDMVAHNSNRDRDVFQISPGVAAESLWLAYQAHIATEVWNANTEVWNSRPIRRKAGRGKRTRGKSVPPVSRHLALHGEVRLPFDPRSTLYNTDGQLFSDMGVPVVLFMENYDINRVGYHDTRDTMANINLDYGAALAAIAIESVARAAQAEHPGWS